MANEGFEVAKTILDLPNSIALTVNDDAWTNYVYGAYNFVFNSIDISVPMHYVQFPNAILTILMHELIHAEQVKQRRLVATDSSDQRLWRWEGIPLERRPEVENIRFSYGVAWGENHFLLPWEIDANTRMLPLTNIVAAQIKDGSAKYFLQQIDQNGNIIC